MKNDGMKWRRMAGAVMIRGIVILMGIQILLGLLWTAVNFPGMQEFGETQELLEIADTMVTDEYIGILYPCLIRFARMLASLLPLPYYVFLYALQWITGFLVLYRVLQAFPWRLPAALWIMTIPTVNQFYLAVLPQSLAASLLLLGLYECRKRRWSLGALWGLLSGLLIPEYFLFALGIYGTAWLASLLGGWKKRDWKGVFWRGGAALLAAVVLALAAGMLFVEPYSRGRMARTPAAMALQRMVWPNFSSNQYFWYGRITDVIQTDELTEISRNPELVARLFGFKMEAVYGKAGAQEIYWDMAEVTFRMRTREIVGNIAGDMISYVLQPFALAYNLRGIGVSFSGWNYGRMAAKAPELTRCYVSFAANAMAPMLLLAVCSRLLADRRCKEDFSEADRERRGLIKCGAVLSLILAGWYTMSASGMQDYKNVILGCMTWGILILGLLAETGGEIRKEEN